MKNDTRKQHACEETELPPSQMLALIEEQMKTMVPASTPRVGRPGKVSWPQFCLGIVWCLLQGWNVQLDLWRWITTGGWGRFEPVDLSDQAVYNRMERAAEPMRAFFEQVSAQLRGWSQGLGEKQLAPFASQVLAVDQCKLDRVARWLASLRELATGDPGLLAGQLNALFDVRQQQWVRVELHRDAAANCKRAVRELISQVEAGCLLLFDRGYFSFAWLDELTQRQIWYVTRYANKASYRVIHIFYQGDGVLDALVQVGAYRADQAQEVVRLVSFWSAGKHFRYLTNVLDPQMLSLMQISQLYARRWDIEMAFRLLKDYLQVGQLWSAKWSVVQVQIWAGLLLAQLFHAAQMRLAYEAGVDPFEVSMELLVRWSGRLLATGTPALPALRRWGTQIGLIRPSARGQWPVPFIDPSWIRAAPAELLVPRAKARHAQRKCAPRSRRASSP